MSTTSDGRTAEQCVARELERLGHTVVTMNWRTRWCEIDIVSTHKKVVYFTEVKFRSSTDWGGGLEYVLSKKLRQMQFAAELWLHQSAWKGEAQLQVAAVGPDQEIEFVEVQ